MIVTSGEAPAQLADKVISVFADGTVKLSALKK